MWNHEDEGLLRIHISDIYTIHMSYYPPKQIWIPSRAILDYSSSYKNASYLTLAERWWFIKVWCIEPYEKWNDIPSK